MIKTIRQRSHDKKGAKQIAAEIEALGYRVPGAKVLVLRDLPAEQQSQDGIIIGEDSQKKPLKGTIICLGQGILRNSADFDMDGIRVLSRCTFSKYEGHVETVTLLDGDFVNVEFLTAADVYLFWPDHGQEESEK